MVPQCRATVADSYENVIMVYGCQSTKNSEVRQVVAAVRRSIDLHGAELSKEFFPAHLTIALIDAVFNANLHYDRVVPIVERYCHRFRLSRLREKGSDLPPIYLQESLSDLIGRYNKLGLDGMQRVFQSRYCSPGTSVLKSDNVKHTAVALRCAGIEKLQDMQKCHPDQTKRVLCPLHGIGPRTVHMLLMYAGNDDLVKGDVHVRQFVSNALGRRVSAEEAEQLVRDAARELGVAPRLLDLKIWEHRKGKRWC